MTANQKALLNRRIAEFRNGKTYTDQEITALLKIGLDNWTGDDRASATLRREMPACRLEYLPSEKVWLCHYDWLRQPILNADDDPDERIAVALAYCRMMSIDLEAIL